MAKAEGSPTAILIGCLVAIILLLLLIIALMLWRLHWRRLLSKVGDGGRVGCGGGERGSGVSLGSAGTRERSRMRIIRGRVSKTPTSRDVGRGYANQEK